MTDKEKNYNECYAPDYVFKSIFRPNINHSKYKYQVIYYTNPWEQAEIEVDRISKEFMQELVNAINKEVERQMKAKGK